METGTNGFAPHRRRGLAELEQRQQTARVAEAVLKEVSKGECPHCRVHIGRGIAFHVRKCATTNPGADNA